MNSPYVQCQQLRHYGPKYLALRRTLGILNGVEYAPRLDQKLADELGGFRDRLLLEVVVGPEEKDER